MHSPALGIQLKSTALDPPADQTKIAFDLKVKNYNDLAHKTLIPRVLVVFLLPKDASQWLTCTEEALVLRRSAYWLSLHGLPPTQKVSTARVHLPRTQVFDTPCVHRLLERVAREEAITP